MSASPPARPGHPGPPSFPELPAGIAPPPPPPAPARGEGLPAWPAWAPFAAMLLTLLVTLVAVLVITVIAQGLGADVDADDTPAGITIGGTVVQGFALAASAVLLARMTAGSATPGDFGLRLPRWGAAAGWTVIAWLTFVTFSGIWSVALDIDESDDLPQELGADESTLALIAVSLMVCLVAPIAEELFFRGFMFTALRRWLGVAGGALVTGAIFGAIHAGGTDAVFLVPLAVFGLVLCLLYWRTGSILPCMVLHALNNSLALGVSLGWPAVAVLGTMVGSVGVILAAGVPLSRSRLSRRPA